MAEFETRVADWLSLEEARERMLRASTPTPPVVRSVPGAVGLALADAVYAPLSLPPLPSSAMDGYAIRGGELEGVTRTSPRRLRVVGVLRPGQAPGVAPGAGEAIRILTGGPVPEGCDTIVRVEDSDAEAEPGWVELRDARDRGQHIRPAGEDVREGERVLEAGAPVDPGAIALLAALGIRELRVHPRPRVAILSTGDELVPAFEDALPPLPPLPVRDANGPALAAAVAAAGGIPLGPRIVPDDEEQLGRAIREAAEGSDLLVISGGASMGDADYVKRVLDALGFQLDFWRVRIRPGSPFGFGTLPRPGAHPLPVVGLPGNPASALVTFEILARPLLRSLGGHHRRDRPVLEAVAGSALPGAGAMTHLARVRLESAGGGWSAWPAGPQRSNLISPLARAHGIAEIPAGGGEIPPGGAVRVHLLTADGW